MEIQMHTTKQKHRFAKLLLAKLGKIGGALLFPIAVLPIAAILLRIGADVPTTTVFSSTVNTILLNAGNVVFDNLAILFAIGLSFSFTKEQRGEAAFSGFIAMVLLTRLIGPLTNLYYGAIDFSGVVGNDADPNQGMGFMQIFGSSFNAVLANNVLNGIVIGALVAFIFNHFHGAQLPKVLGFFAGKRLIPALAIIFTTIFTLLWAALFPWIGFVIFIISENLSKATQPGSGQSNDGSLLAIRAAISGTYGFLNRLLIPFGLHHIPNNIFWFQLGTFMDEQGNVVNGDIFIFLRGVAANNPGGLFQSPFFPMMMFGLPALVAAFWYRADNKVQRSRVLALFGSAATVSFLTGITEPIEFAFVYVSPLLYLFHALLTALFGFVTVLFGIQIGFGFSAGVIDYLISIPKSLAIISDSNFSGARATFANPGWVIPIGLLCGATYFLSASYLIKKFNLATPGRSTNVLLAEETSEQTAVVTNATPTSGTYDLATMSAKAQKIVLAYGGYENIVDFKNCSTRLRYIVKDASKVDVAALKKAGAYGVVKVSDTSVQTIVGVEAENLNNEIVAHRDQKIS